MYNNMKLFVFLAFLMSISISQTPCILGDVYVSEAANAGDPEDYIEVYNGGDVECTLAGFQLDDSDEDDDFTFGGVVLAPGEFWLGYEDDDDSFGSGLVGGGDDVVFADADGNMLIVVLEEAIEIAEGIELSTCFHLHPQTPHHHHLQQDLNQNYHHHLHSPARIHPVPKQHLQM
jgi:hypothetical protein